ncbi:MAG: class I SAM-dependent methyltransferase [Opitutales bacterium]|nr:class I SAM-dependent methyltransferase [Opitutales bacterium]
MTACRRGFRRKHANAVTELRRFARDNDFEHDWFSGNVPFWLEIFESYGLRGRPIRAMEIGSFEGLSACFIFQQLPEALLTCVDTWDGSDEHVGMRRIQSIEAAFDKNIAPWRDRVTKHKSNSLDYLASLGAQDKFDFIYVDGSHHADDVMIDAIRSFEQLKVGGVMIMDDYLWRYYPRSSEDPARAISGFLRLAEGRFKLIMTYRQLALVKTAERSV